MGKEQLDLSTKSKRNLFTGAEKFRSSAPPLTPELARRLTALALSGIEQASQLSRKPPLPQEHDPLWFYSLEL
jgi:hypothetical protein